MYLSHVILDTSSRKVIEGMSRPSLFHGAIEWSVGQERTRNLWRIDHLRDKDCLILLTPVMPDLTKLQKQFGCQDEEPLTKLYDPFLQKLHAGQTWRFRIKINPVKVHDGKRYPVMNRDLSDWFLDKAKLFGMEIDEGTLSIVEIKEYNFYKDIDMRQQRNNYVRFKAVTYEGMLKITDDKKVRDILINGIGKEKAYGCGMLTLARL